MALPSHAFWFKNPTKNRATNILCYDRSRVVLDEDDDESGSYIHANQVRLPGGCTTYILTQLPLKKTVVDFWRMVWKLKPLTIAVLSQPFRDEERFLPMVGQKVTFGQFEVRRVSELDSNEWWTTVDCLVQKGDESLNLRCTMWYEWLRDGDPPKPSRMIAFVQELHIQRDQEGEAKTVCDLSKSGGAVIVCPTGAIRSGLVAASSALIQIVSEGDFEESVIDKVVKKLREARHGTIDRRSQDAYLRWLVREARLDDCDGNTPADEKKRLNDAVETARAGYIAASRREKLAAIDAYIAIQFRV